MHAKWDSEKELAKVVVDDYRAKGWSVYPEIMEIDIIATKPDNSYPNNLRVVGIECKKHFNLTVLSQAYKRRCYVDEMNVAVGKCYQKDEWFGCEVAKRFGLGVLYVSKHKDSYGICPDYYYDIKQQINAEVIKRKHYSVDGLLCSKAESYAEAGQAGGKSWSLFKMTVDKLTDYVKDNPGISLTEVVSKIEHHYSNNKSARSCLSSLIKGNVIKTVTLKDKLLFPV